MIRSTLDTQSPAFRAAYENGLAQVSALDGELARSRAGGGPKYVERHRGRGKLLARERRDGHLRQSRQPGLVAPIGFGHDELQRRGRPLARPAIAGGVGREAALPIDGLADQYALAATAFHLLTGMPVFHDANPAVVISKHLTSPPPEIAKRRPELSDLRAAFADCTRRAGSGVSGVGVAAISGGGGADGQWRYR